MPPHERLQWEEISSDTGPAIFYSHLSGSLVADVMVGRCECDPHEDTGGKLVCPDIAGSAYGGFGGRQAGSPERWLLGRGGWQRSVCGFVPRRFSLRPYWYDMTIHCGRVDL